MGRLGVFLALMFPGPVWGFMDPPARFDHPNRHVLVKRTSSEEVWRVCHHGGEHVIVACALRQVGGPWCLVLLTAGRWDEARVLRHEVAHCNGWPADHPR